MLDEELRFWYGFVEKHEHIHLGVADKFLLRNYIQRVRGDVVGTIAIFLKSMGYESKTLTENFEEVKKLEKDYLEIWLENNKSTS